MDEAVDRVYFDEVQPIEKSGWEPVVANSSGGHKLQMTVKFNRSSAESSKSFCRICLGDKKNSQSPDRYDKPYLESPPLYTKSLSGMRFFLYFCFNFFRSIISYGWRSAYIKIRAKLIFFSLPANRF